MRSASHSFVLLNYMEVMLIMIKKVLGFVSIFCLCVVFGQSSNGGGYSADGIYYSAAAAATRGSSFVYEGPVAQTQTQTIVTAPITAPTISLLPAPIASSTYAVQSSTGYDYNGYDSEGYDVDGYDVYSYDREGYNIAGYSIYGYDREGYSVAGYDANGYDREGYDAMGLDVYGYYRDGTLGSK